ncbi:MAG TPA: flagellar biosynthesis protein FlhF [Spirochaetota bacterium]|nr:flagellar biosynthesis protein FlhF [Spirochaetota bacterium]
MRYVKIRAKTYNEAMMNLKMEHGDDAIPISHKNVKDGGLFNTSFFARDIVELTAAIPERKNVPRIKPAQKTGFDITVGDNAAAGRQTESQKQFAGTQAAVQSSSTEILNPGIAKKAAQETNEAEKEKSSPVAQGLDGEKDRQSFEKLEKEFHELKSMLNMLLDQKETKSHSPEKQDDENDEVMQHFREMLKNNDFNDDECHEMLGKVKRSVSSEDMKDKYKIEKSLRDLLKSKIVVSGPIEKGKKKKVLMFIGPTGVGKTTTMAKLGAIYALREGVKVSFITIDNYRIAATEQLKKYAEIMKIPIHVVIDHNSFKEVLENESADIIMVDTSGRSHRSELKISEIKAFADASGHEIQKVLCVSANTKKVDLMDVFRSYEKINIDSVIITKVDETTFIGNVIDVADKYNKPIAYYTNGQEVPNDISVANSDSIVDMVIGKTAS